MAAITMTSAEAKRFALGGAGGLAGILTSVAVGTRVVAISHLNGTDLWHNKLPR